MSSAFRTRSPKLSSVRYVAGNQQGGGGCRLAAVVRSPLEDERRFLR